MKPSEISVNLAYEFGGYRFEPFNARLVRGDEVVPLNSRALDTLTILVEHAGSVVSKDDLMAAVWPGIAVEENNLNQQVSALRKALAQAGGSVSIQAVPKRGYRFVGAVRRIDVPSESTTGPSHAPVASSSPGSSRRPVVLAGAVAVVLGVAVVGLYSFSSEGRARRPSRSSSGTPYERSVEAVSRGNELLRAGNTSGAVQEMKEAVRIDPTNARAHASLARALHTSASAGVSTSAVRPAGHSPSVQAARRAVELDPLCAECRGSFGFYLFYHDWQFKEAEAQLREAIRLEPQSKSLRPSYAMLLAVTGRPTEALEQVDVALEQDPIRVAWLVIRASAQYFSRQYEDAIATADRALAVDPTAVGAWDWRSKALFQLGRGQEALHALAQNAFASHSTEIDQAVRQGGVDAGLRKLLELTDDWRGRIEHAWRRASWRALLNDTDGALEELERAHDMRRFNAINLGADPVYDKIRSHPRFRKILTSLGLDAWF